MEQLLENNFWILAEDPKLQKKKKKKQAYLLRTR